MSIEKKVSRLMEGLKPALEVEQWIPFSIDPDISRVTTRYANGALLLHSQRINVADLTTGTIDVLKDVELLTQLTRGRVAFGISLPAGNGLPRNYGEGDEVEDPRTPFEKLPNNFLIHFDKLTADQAHRLRCEMEYGSNVYVGNLRVDSVPRKTRKHEEKFAAWINLWHERTAEGTAEGDEQKLVEVLYPHDPAVLKAVKFKIFLAPSPREFKSIYPEL